MIAGNLGDWIEGAALVGFVVANVAGVFVVLFRALGMPDEAPARVEVPDRGGMTAAGVPYVLGTTGERADVTVGSVRLVPEVNT